MAARWSHVSEVRPSGLIRQVRLERGAQAHIELPACQVVGDGVLDVVHVGALVVAAHVGNVHKVETVQIQLNMNPAQLRDFFLNLQHELYNGPAVTSATA